MKRAFVGCLAVLISLMFAFGCGGGKHGGFNGDLNSGVNEPSINNPKPLGDGRGTTVTFRITRGLFTHVNPYWAAYRDGDGPWQVINPTTTGVYQFSISDSLGRYGFAFVMGNTVNIRYGTISELTQWHEQLSWVSSPDLVVSGSATDTGGVLINGTGAFIGSDKNYSVTVPPGRWDLIAISGNRIYIQRDLLVNSNVIHNIDFNDPVKSRSWEDKERGYIFATSKGVDEAYLFLLSNRNTTLELFYCTYPSEDIWTTYPSIPHSISHPNDVYVAGINCYDSRSGSLIETLQISSLPRDFVLLPPTPLVGIGGAGSVITGLRYKDASWWDVILKSQSVTWLITFTSDWLGNRDSFTLPNFSSLPGWSNNWSLPSMNVSLSMVRVAVSNKPISQLMNAQWVSTRINRDYNDLPIRFLTDYIYPVNSFPKVDNLELKYATRFQPNSNFRLKKIF